MVANTVSHRAGLIKSGPLAGQPANVVIIEGVIDERDDLRGIFQSMSEQAFASNAPLLFKGYFSAESDVVRLIEQVWRCGASVVAVCNTRQEQRGFVIWTFRKNVGPTTDVIEDVEILKVY